MIDVDRLPAIAVVGYSLGGNLTLKLAGDYGDAAPRELVAVCAVSPTMDLALCVRALEQRANVIYQWNFVRNLKNRMRRKAALFPGMYDLKPLANVWTVRGFDEAYTAPHHGFRDADDYYFRASALRVIDKVRVPALIIASDNDPFVPAEQFRRPEVAGQSARHGGDHARRRPLRVRRRVADRLRRLLGRTARDRVHSRLLQRPPRPSPLPKGEGLDCLGRGRPRTVLEAARLPSAPAPAASMPSSFSRIAANSGPFPSSSCLK